MKTPGQLADELAALGEKATAVALMPGRRKQIEAALRLLDDAMKIVETSDFDTRTAGVVDEYRALCADLGGEGE